MQGVVTLLKEHVTTFSTMIKKESHGRDVVVGGVVTNILDIGELLGVDEEGTYVEGVYLTVDDGIGEYTVIFSKEYYDSLVMLDKDLFTTDRILLFTGKVFALDTTHTYPNRFDKIVKTHNKTEETTSILSWKVVTLAE